MKKVFIVNMLTALALVSSWAQADNTRLVNADGSALSHLCIAAAKSEDHGLSPIELRDVRCNGMTVEMFVYKTKQALRRKQMAYLASLQDDSDVSQLCMAALQSAEVYAATKKELFGETTDIEGSVLCNDMPIRVFARKFRNRTVTAGL